MRKYKLTTQAFISSIISIVLCAVMLMGTTFAWYTDGVKVDVEDIQAGEFEKEVTTEEETTAEKETTTEKESTTEKETTTESTTETTTETTTESTTETTTEITTESTTEPTTESTTESTTEPTTESTTESTTEATTQPSEPPRAEGAVWVIEDGNNHENGEASFGNEECKAETYVQVKETVNMIIIDSVEADVFDGVKIENGGAVNVIAIYNSDFTLSEDGKIILNDSEKADIIVRLYNVTVNGVKITSANASEYTSGIKKSNIMFL